MTEQLPQVSHTYKNHTLDSTRWQHYQPRAGDIVIATSYKSGTTWMQEIVRQLLFVSQAVPAKDRGDLGTMSPWLDLRFGPVDEVIASLEAQQHRRFMKSHLPLDGLPFYPQVNYVIVGRDARDVAMSMWNHHSGYTDGAFAGMQNAPGRLGDPLPPATDIHDFWQNWISRGWFPWESEGYPYWGNLHHTTLDTMRATAERLNPNMTDFWKEGAKTFFFKGTNGRWKDVLSAEELALYEQKAAQVLTPDCRAWLEQGRCVSRFQSRSDG